MSCDDGRTTRAPTDETVRDESDRTPVGFHSQPHHRRPHRRAWPETIRGHAKGQLHICRLLRQHRENSVVLAIRLRRQTRATSVCSIRTMRSRWARASSRANKAGWRRSTADWPPPPCEVATVEGKLLTHPNPKIEISTMCEIFLKVRLQLRIDLDGNDPSCCGARACRQSPSTRPDLQHRSSGRSAARSRFCG